MADDHVELRAPAAILWASVVLLACSPEGPQEEVRVGSRAPSGGFNLAQAALSHSGFDWDAVPAPTFTLYLERGSFASARATEYRKQVEAAIAHALDMIDEPTYPGHLRVFFVESRTEVEALVGIGYNGWSDAAAGAVLVVASDQCRPFLRHEIMHAVSVLLWGHPLGAEGDPNYPNDRDVFERGGWLREGIAAAAEDLHVSYSYRDMAAQSQAEGILLPLDSLVNGFYRQDDLAAYLQAGALVQYLLETYGNAGFRRVWREGESAFERVYGKGGSDLETEWHGWLQATPASARPRSVATARSENRSPPRRR